MKKTDLLILFFVFLSVGLYAQQRKRDPVDIIFLKTGDKISCRILSEDSAVVNYAIKERGVNVTSSIEKDKIDRITYATYSDEEDNAEYEKFTLGVIGIGFDYGGIGMNGTYYLNRNFGLFAGVGYALAGVGVNGGVRIKLIPQDHRIRRAVPFFTGMYGYNAAIAIADARQWSKLFYGPTFGFGLDVHQKQPKTGLWSFALLLPLRGEKVDDYMDMLQTTQGIKFENELFPITFSIGFKLKLQ